MKLIGYWNEPLNNDYFPPQEIVGLMSNADRKAVVDYLERGALFETYRGSSHCRFGCKDDVGFREYTDGVWVWPEGLAHYVREHGIILPEEFIEDVRHPKLRIPESKWVRDPLDHEFWKDWCRRYASTRCRG